MTAKDTKCLGCHAEAQAASKAEAAFIGYFTGKLPFRGDASGAITPTWEIGDADVCPEHRAIVETACDVVRALKASRT